jgi:hypothetical protein
MKVNVITSCVASNHIPRKNIKDFYGKPISFDDEDLMVSTFKTILG